jgi:hypothetical protein
MKYLILFAVLAVVYLLWRSQQRRAQAASPEHRAGAPR